MSTSDKSRTIVELAEKHYVSLTKWQKKPYFHITNKYNGKSVSMGIADMQCLVDNFKVMKRKLKDIREDDGDEKKKTKKNKKRKMMMKKNKKQRTCDDDDNDDDDSDDDDSDDEDDDDDQ